MDPTCADIQPEYPSLPTRESCLLHKNIYYYSFVFLFSFTSFEGVPCFRIPVPEAEFLDVIGTKVLRAFLLSIHSHLHYEFYPPPSKSGLKLVCNVNIVFGNLKSKNSQDYAQKPQRNSMFMNSPSDSLLSPLIKVRIFLE
jgi:hypothetical protein